MLFSAQIGDGSDNPCSVSNELVALFHLVRQLNESSPAFIAFQL